MKHIKSVLITLGPTREYIDYVRFISNSSTGRMGLALAQAALDRGWDVGIISGPINLSYPETARVYTVVSASEMEYKTMQELSKDNGYDAFISTAAIADYTPKKRISGKIPSQKDELSIRLKQTTKLLHEVRSKYPDLFIVGFKAEYGCSTDELILKAKRIKQRYKLQMVVANDLSKNPFGDKENTAIIISAKGEMVLGQMPKESLSERILDSMIELF